MRTDNSSFNLSERSSLIGAIDILRARRATGLIVSSGYSTVKIGLIYLDAFGELLPGFDTFEW